ncbi:MAG: hypothetical protein Q8L65_08235, partial [Burkholderiales bacterium]|nr:hypothetical protein [Burkholderiales bacterium]
MKRHYPLHIHISTLFLLLLLIVGGSLAAVSYTMSRDVLETSAEDLTQRISRETLGDFQRLIEPAAMAVNMLSYDTLTAATSLGARMGRLELLRKVLDNAPALSSVYVGYGNGDFFFVRRLRDAAERQLLKAPPDTQYMVQSIERGSAIGDRGTYLYLGSSLQVLRQEDRPEYVASYDPRTRGWFIESLSTSGMTRTPPYLFFSNRRVGMTLATRANLGFGVVGADILLETLGENLARQKVTPGTQIALVDAQGRLIAHEDVKRLVTVPAGADAQLALTRMADSGLPALPELARHIEAMKSTGPLRLRLQADGADWRAEIKPVLTDGDQPLYLVSAIPDHELLAAANDLRNSALIITLLIIVFSLPVAWWVAHALARSLRQLAAEAEAIRNFDFAKSSAVYSVVDEVDQLAVTMEGMKLAIRRFLDISLVIAAEKDI